MLISANKEQDVHSLNIPEQNTFKFSGAFHNRTAKIILKFWQTVNICALKIILLFQTIFFIFQQGWWI